ncbi:glucosamine-6-phosphate deaminase [Anaerophilus nitritogenes]|uniref:glucosamine-6-phosphate deaminase n=1 Tax=Anaerophilus nitritogenes TaxID=2498136 RepID=UPI00101B6F03|nr:glucosamine-6-phosphate deaminase [Anaerophilus nitritogenes]
MKIIKVRNYEEMSDIAAEYVTTLIKEKPDTVLGLATGSTPIGLYKRLIKDHNENKTSYENIKTFNLDEYIGLDKNNSQSYHYFMHEHLFKNININKKNIYIPNGFAKDINKECIEYNEKLKNNVIHLQILGIGSNGHIGFNEPGTSFSSEVHVVKLDENTRKANSRFFNQINEVPTYSITMGIKNIMEAKQIILLASGNQKANAIYDTIHGEVTENVPASILRTHPNIIVIVDEEASSLV